MIAPYLASSSVNFFKAENKSQYILSKYHNSIRIKDFLIHEKIPVTLYSNMLTFRDSNKSFNRDGDLLKMMTKYKFNVVHSNPQDRKKINNFAKEMNFVIKNIGRKSPKDGSIVELLKSPAIMASGTSTRVLSSDPNELCDRLKLLLQERQAGNISIIINDEIVAIVDKLLKYKYIC